MSTRIIHNPFHTELPRSGPIVTSIDSLVRLNRDQIQVFQDFSVIPVENPKANYKRDNQSHHNNKTQTT